MADFLLVSTKRGSRPPAVQATLVVENAKYEADQKTMFAMAEESKWHTDIHLFYICNTILMPLIVMNERRANPSDRQDVLGLMMYGKDKETGLSLPDKTVQYNVRLRT